MLMKKRLRIWQIFHLEKHRDPGGGRVRHMFLSRYLLIGGDIPLLTRKPDSGMLIFLEEILGGNHTSSVLCDSILLVR